MSIETPRIKSRTFHTRGIKIALPTKLLEHTSDGYKTPQMKSIKNTHPMNTRTFEQLECNLFLLKYNAC